MTFIKHLRINYYTSLLSKDIPFYDTHRTSDLFSLLTGELEHLKATSIVDIFSNIEQLISFIGAIISLMCINYKLSLLICISIPICIYLLNNSHFMHKMRSHTVHSHKKSSHNLVLEAIDNIRIVKAFSTEDKEIHKYEKKIDEMYDTEYKCLLRNGMFDFAVQIGIWMYIGVVVKVGYEEVIKGTLSKEELIKFCAYVKIVYDVVVNVGKVQRRIVKGLLIAKRMFDIIDYTPSVKPNSGNDTTIIDGDISIQNVSFNYPTKPDTSVLTDLSLTVPKSTSIGIVGTSGSGKTTIINLLLRLYEPLLSSSSSSISFSSVPLSQFNLKHLHNQIGYISQEPSLFNGTIYDNITYGTTSPVSFKDIKQAITSAQCEFVFDKEKFPKGMDTNVGERGVQLSGGQKQRVAIARALVKKPKILLLDEATSALDAENEYAFQKGLEEYRKEHEVTVVIVAHRLSTVKTCDKIVVLDKGKICESGTHDELIKMNGVYKQLMDKQISVSK